LDHGREPWDTVTPLREWNAEGWYVNGEGIGLKVYRVDKGAVPPQHIVDLFNELTKIPRSRESQSEIRDICLGFCYDPLSALGFIFANERCQYRGTKIVCR